MNQRPYHPLIVWDRALLVWMVRATAVETALLTRGMRLLTKLGNAESWVLAVLLLSLAGPEGRLHATLIGLGAGLATLTSQVLKRLACRPRPAAGLPGFTARVELPDEFSFPSGHTAAAFAVAVALSGALALPGSAALLVLAFGIGSSRIYLGAHYPLDVAAGAVLGSLCGAAARGLVGLAG